MIELVIDRLVEDQVKDYKEQVKKDKQFKYNQNMKLYYAQCLEKLCKRLRIIKKKNNTLEHEINTKPVCSKLYNQ